GRAANSSPPPCGEGLGVGVVGGGISVPHLPDPPPQSSPTRGEGIAAAPPRLNSAPTRPPVGTGFRCGRAANASPPPRGERLGGGARGGMSVPQLPDPPPQPPPTRGEGAAVDWPWLNIPFCPPAAPTRCAAI